MTLPPVMRIFFAIELPQTVKEKLGRYIGTLKKKSKSQSIRWSKPENLHVTLQFLAEVRSEHLQSMLDNVRGLVQGKVGKKMLTIGQVHMFPNPFRPRVIVLELGPQDELAALAGKIGQGIQASGYEIEDRPFRAHLTLGRIKQPYGVDLGFLNETPLPEVEEIETAEVVLYRSEPQQDGSKYTVLERITL